MPGNKCHPSKLGLKAARARNHLETEELYFLMVDVLKILNNTILIGTSKGSFVEKLLDTERKPHYASASGYFHLTLPPRHTPPRIAFLSHDPQPHTTSNSHYLEVRRGEKR